MAKYGIRGTKTWVNLGQNEFKTKGGEGSIYIIGDRVYKVCDPGKMIPEKKIDELAALKHPNLMIPDGILIDEKKHVVGYTMPAVPNNPVPLAQILTRAYRESNHITPEKMAKLVLKVVEITRFVHTHPHYLQVDGANEFNLMVTEQYDDIFGIDVNSYQTPTYPADAIMASIRDWHVGQDASGRWQWSQGSDWWSVGIIAFYMLTGLHPFKARFKGFDNLKTYMIDQMKAYKSAFLPEAMFPQAAVYTPFEDAIPGGKSGAYWQWLWSMFVEGKRLAAPDGFQAVVKFVTKVHEIIGSNNFIMQVLHEYASKVLGCYFQEGKEVVVCQNDLYVNNQRMNRVADKMAIGFATKMNIPIVAHLENGNLRLQNLESKVPIRIELQAQDLMSCEGRIYARGQRDIFEIEVMQANNVFLGFARLVANVMPHATTMFEGGAIQDMFGACMVSIFPDSGMHRQLKIDELAGYRITQARYEGNVLMVVGVNRKTGEYDRLRFRFSKDWKTYDCVTTEGIQPTGINFTVTTKGICICITEEEKVEIFSSQMGSQTVKSYADPAVKGDMRLCHSDAQVRFAHGGKLYSFAMK